MRTQLRYKITPRFYSFFFIEMEYFEAVIQKARQLYGSENVCVDTYYHSQKEDAETYKGIVIDANVFAKEIRIKLRDELMLFLQQYDELDINDGSDDDAGYDICVEGVDDDFIVVINGPH